MELKLDMTTVDDISGIVDVYPAAFINRFTAYLFPDRSILPRWLADDYKKDMTTKPLAHFYKITDVSVGKIVGFAQWDFPDRQTGSAITTSKTKCKRDWPKGPNVEFCEWFFGKLAKRREEIMGDSTFY